MANALDNVKGDFFHTTGDLLKIGIEKLEASVKSTG